MQALTEARVVTCSLATLEISYSYVGYVRIRMNFDDNSSDNYNKMRDRYLQIGTVPCL